MNWSRSKLNHHYNSLILDVPDSTCPNDDEDMFFSGASYHCGIIYGTPPTQGLMDEWYDCVSELINHYSARKILDPLTAVDSPSNYVKGVSVDRYCPIPEWEEYFSLVPECEGVKFSEFKSTNEEAYDILLLNEFKLGLSQLDEHYKMNFGDGHYSLKTLKEVAILEESIKCLKNDGKIILTTDSTNWNIENIRNYGFSIECVYGLYRQEEFENGSTLGDPDYAIIVASKGGGSSDPFISLSRNRQNLQQSILNYTNSIDSMDPWGGGMNLRIDELHGVYYSALEAKYKYKLSEISFERKKFGDVATSISEAKYSEYSDIQIPDNSILIPASRTFAQFSMIKSITPAITSSQVILDEGYYIVTLNQSINKTYFYTWLNSFIGSLFCSCIKNIIGNSMNGRIKKIESLEIPYRNLDIQIRISDEYHRISFLREELNSSLNDIGEADCDLDSVRGNIESLFTNASKEEWVNVLPYPLASILWRFYATEDSSKKVQHALHFFEALAQFLVVIGLSVINTADSESYLENSNWSSNSNWEKKVTFGGWIYVFSKVREFFMDSSANPNAYFENLFDGDSRGIYELLTNETVLDVLVKACNYRNVWVGHAGVSSDKEEKIRLSILETLFDLIRTKLVRTFRNVSLISPTTFRFSNRKYYCNVKFLVGVRTPFREEAVAVTNPLDQEYLYLICKGSQKSVELLPFVKFKTDNDATYFYSSIESSGVRWVSYHYEAVSEINDDVNEDIMNALKILNPNPKSKTKVR